MSERRLVVVIHGQVVGHVTQRHRSAEPEFRYDPEYVNSSRTPLSVLMPVADDSYRGVRVRAYLEGVLPEDPQTRRRWASQLAVEPDDHIGILSQMGWDCPGAVQFCMPAELDDLLSRTRETHPVADEDIAHRLRDLRTLAEPSWTMPTEHWSLPGQQAKFALIRRGDAWHEARGATATTHILKPGIGRLHHQALVEHATMRAAHAAGLDVAPTEFTHFADGEPAIVIERYDRITLEDDTVIRLHQEDFCSASGRLPEKKYEAHGGPGLKDLVRTVRQNVPDRRAGVRAIGDFAAFNYVSGSPDGHSKNLALLLLPDQMRVAPLYDLATALPYESTPGLREVAVSIGGRRQFGQVLGKHWDRAAGVLDTPAEEYRDRVRGFAAVFPDAFADALRDVGTPEADQVRNHSMDAIGRHTRQLLARLDDPVETTSRRPVADS